MCCLLWQGLRKMNSNISQTLFDGLSVLPFVGILFDGVASPVQTCIMRIGEEIWRKLLTEWGSDGKEEMCLSESVFCLFGVD